MMTKIDKRDRADLFRTRLARAMEEQGQSRSALARAIGVDRSTVSQLLAEGQTRLPNAHVVGECAARLGVSADWLLGLTERPEPAGELFGAGLTVTDAPRSSIDDQIIDWHREASGYKIRHVPTTLPDMLKTRAMLRWEYADHFSRTPDQAIGAVEDRLAWIREATSDYEIAFPLHELESFARAEGYYRGLDAALRRDQLAWLAELHDRFYPTLRIFLFDARLVFSAPMTVFGPRMASIYVGHHYLVFRDAERVRTLTRHFDGLVREARTDARDFPAHAAALAAEV
ncbi:transcriptional regulator [Maritimibacter sp. 55A14]|uniref:helix-turn-helix domain-containing protein n=1 Tax=Maritimibacter sp. 55A14 TaxID=2174844 RepID=UPI000D6186E3|nr:helix-turn-helix transcriptional regulator [Maritimibacter sp. 55A14]PWE33849.1 transcriptional regulator [Maritimibacter sp. 55A14]